MRAWEDLGAHSRPLLMGYPSPYQIPKIFDPNSLHASIYPLIYTCAVISTPKTRPRGPGELFEMNPAFASILSGLSSAVDANRERPAGG
jgi:hypothetical protein